MPLLAAFLLFAATAVAATRLCADGRERVACAWLLLSSALYLTALCASLAEMLAEPLAWLAGGAIALGVTMLAKKPPGRRARLSPPPVPALLPWLPVAVFALLVFAHGVSRAPGNWDGVSYVLPRALYFLQFGSFADFPTPTATQVFHPLLGAVWHSFIFVALGERLLFLPQWLAWLVAATAAAGLAHRIRPSATKSLPWLTAIFALFPLVTLLEASTEKTDLLVAAYGACAFLFALSASRVSGPLSALAIAFAAAVKGSALPLLPLWALAFWWFRKERKETMRSAILAGAILLFVLATCGYGKNLARYGHPLGPKEVIGEYSFAAPGEAAAEGTKNILRYALDAASPDGLPGLPLADSFTRAWRNLFGGFPASGRTHGGFDRERGSLAHEDVTAFGAIYFALFAYLTGRFLLGQRRQKKKDKPLLALLGATLFVFLFHCYTAVYDPWHGRFFTVNVIFLAPFLALAAEDTWKSKKLRTPLVILFSLLAGQSLWSLVFRTNTPLFSPGTRIAQVLRDRPDFLPAFTALEELVPPDALLATRLPFDFPEYALFGPELRRVVIPTVDFRAGKRPVPPNAVWLVFDERLEEIRDGDQTLGRGLWLRQLIRQK